MTASCWIERAPEKSASSPSRPQHDWMSIPLNLLEPTLSLLLCPCLFSLILRIFLFPLLRKAACMIFLQNSNSIRSQSLKLIASGVFNFRFFSRIIFPQAKDYPAVGFLQKYTNILAAQGAPPAVSTTTGRSWPPVSLTPAANSRLESTTPVVTFFLEIYIDRDDTLDKICHHKRHQRRKLKTFMVVGTLFLGTDSFRGINSSEKQFLEMELRFSIFLY